MPIDFAYFPHILDAIIRGADDDGLRRMRTASRELKQIAEKELHETRIVHLVVGRSMDLESLHVFGDPQQEELLKRIYTLFAHSHGYPDRRPLEDLEETLPSVLVLSCHNPEIYRQDPFRSGWEHFSRQLSSHRLPSIKVTRILPPIIKKINIFPTHHGHTVVVMMTMLKLPYAHLWNRYIALLPDFEHHCCPRLVFTVLLDTHDRGWHADGLISRFRMLNGGLYNSVHELVIFLTVSHLRPTMPDHPERGFAGFQPIARPEDRDVCHGVLDLLLESLAVFLLETQETGSTVSIVGLADVMDTFPPEVLGLSQPTDLGTVETRIRGTLALLLIRVHQQQRKVELNKAVDQLLPFNAFDVDEPVNQIPAATDDWDPASLLDRLRFPSAEEYRSEVGDFQYKLETEE